MECDKAQFIHTFVVACDFDDKKVFYLVFILLIVSAAQSDRHNSTLSLYYTLLHALLLRF